MAKRLLSILIPMVLAAGGLLANAALLSAGELFHSGSTGKCEGCHSFRAVQQAPGQAAPDQETTIAASRELIDDPGMPGQNAAEPAGTMMLRGSDPSSTCLLCHEAPAGGMPPQDHHVATSQGVIRQSVPPAQLTPAGDFAWLKKNYRWQNGGGRVESSPGERHGHNIVAMDFNYVADGTLRTAPGGTYPAGSLSCISCHDPHGNYRRSASGAIGTAGAAIIGSGSYSTSPTPDGGSPVGSYRLLAGKGYQPKSLPGAVAFTSDPPAAVAPPSYNRPESVSDTRVAYGSGMSEWCRNCHTQIHNDGNSSASGHPAGNGARLSPKVMAIYNYYLKSGDLSGSGVSSYTSMVPFEMGTDDHALLRMTANSDGSNLRGPEAGQGSPNVMCLSCHRAHASGWDSMTRWNASATFIVYDGRYPGVDNGAPSHHAQGRTEAEARKAFYDRPASRYASYQRSLCNKCHAQD